MKQCLAVTSAGAQRAPPSTRPRVWLALCLQPRTNGETDLPPNLVPAGPGWGCPWSVDNSDLAHEGLESRPWTRLPSARAGEPGTNQRPAFPTPPGMRCWRANKNQRRLLRGHLSFAKRLTVWQRGKELVPELCLCERWVPPASKKTS